MKIPNPWPWHALSRYTCRGPKGENVVIESSRDREVEVDDCDEILIEPVKQVGRGGQVQAIGQGRIWSKKWGLLDLEDHLKKQQIEAEDAELKIKQRKQREKEKAAKVVSEKPARVITEKAVVVDDKLDMGSELEL